MLKSELIKQLEAIDGDPMVVVDIDGRFSSDVKPMVLRVDAKALASFDVKDTVSMRPKLNDTIILL